MAWKWYVWVFLLLGVMIIVLIGLIIYTVGGIGLSGVELEECGVLQNNNGKINIVFFSEKKDAEKYVNYFLNFYPFVDFQNAFNFFYINSYKPKCELYKGIAILCYSRELIKKAGSCPNDYIVVLEDREQSLRSSSYVNVMSINSRQPLSVLAHEFAHVFANLAEEYVPAKIPRGAPNCPGDCSGFEGRENGCYDGCSETEKIRSIENGIMRTLRSKDYGSFNDVFIIGRINEESSGEEAVGVSPSEEPTINTFMDPLIVGRAINDEGRADCSREKYYLIEGRLSDENIEVNSRSVEMGCIGDNGYGGFNYDLIMKDGGSLKGGKFNPELIFTAAPGSDEEGLIDGDVFVSDRNFLLRIPIIENSRELEIMADEILLGSINLYDIGGRACLLE